MGRSRWVVPILFLLITAASALAAGFVHRDATWLQIWLSVALTFLTAAVVDLVALNDSRRKERAAAARIEPVDRIIVKHMRVQRGDLYSLAGSLFGIKDFADAEDLIVQLRDFPKGPTIAADALDETMWPHESRSTRTRATIETLHARQKDLETFAATGLRALEIEALSGVILNGPFVQSIRSTFWGKNSIEQQAAAERAAEMLEELHRIAIPPG